MQDHLFFTHEQYNAMVADTVQELIRLGKMKGAEYAGDHNRLDNFVRAAERLQLQPEQVWAVYAGKHWDAITQYVQDMQTGKQRPRSESILGRMDDMMVYLLLGKAMLYARGMIEDTPAAGYDKGTAETYDGAKKPSY